MIPTGSAAAPTTRTSRREDRAVPHCGSAPNQPYDGIVVAGADSQPPRERHARTAASIRTPPRQTRIGRKRTDRPGVDCPDLRFITHRESLDGARSTQAPGRAYVTRRARPSSRAASPSSAIAAPQPPSTGTIAGSSVARVPGRAYRTPPATTRWSRRVNATASRPNSAPPVSRSKATSRRTRVPTSGGTPSDRINDGGRACPPCAEARRAEPAADRAHGQRPVSGWSAPSRSAIGTPPGPSRP